MGHYRSEMVAETDSDRAFTESLATRERLGFRSARWNQVGLDPPPYPVECPVCAAIVNDMERHHAWHRDGSG